MVSFSMPHHLRASFILFVLIFVFLFFYVIIQSAYQDVLDRLPRHLRIYLPNQDADDLNVTLNIDHLKLELEKINNIKNVSNLGSFGPVSDDAPVITVQVHKDFRRLRYLILSLAQVRDIQTAILVFSHSHYSESINRLIRSIDFCKVMQIFYPYSLQLNPYKFPGIDPGDCAPPGPAAAPCAERDARFAEHKQHWWWKTNFIFQKILPRRHRSFVIFLEESDYVAPDLLYMLQYARRSLEYFPNVQVLSFGKPFTQTTEIDLLMFEPWRPPYDVGLAFNRTAWEKMLSNSAQFCMYDDCSWSYSLYNLFKNFPGSHAQMIRCAVPRVISTKPYNDTEDLLRKLLNIFSTIQFFPKKVKAVFLFGPGGVATRPPWSPPRGAGGWGDLRDQLLCLDPLAATTTEEQRYDDADATRRFDKNNYENA